VIWGLHTSESASELNSFAFMNISRHRTFNGSGLSKHFAGSLPRVVLVFCHLRQVSSQFQFAVSLCCFSLPSLPRFYFLCLVAFNTVNILLAQLMRNYCVYLIYSLSRGKFLVSVSRLCPL